MCEGKSFEQRVLAWTSEWNIWKSCGKLIKVVDLCLFCLFSRNLNSQWLTILKRQASLKQSFTSNTLEMRDIVIIPILIWTIESENFFVLKSTKKIMNQMRKWRYQTCNSNSWWILVLPKNVIRKSRSCFCYCFWRNIFQENTCFKIL